MDFVFFTPSLEGGVGRVVTHLADGVAATGRVVEIWAAAPEVNVEYKVSNRVLIRRIGRGSVLSAIPNLILNLRRRRPKTLISLAFHANCASIIASIIAPSQTRFTISDHPSIDSALTELSPFKKFVWQQLIRRLYPRANRYIAVSTGVARAMSEYGGIPLDQIEVIYNPVITSELFQRASAQPLEPFPKTKHPALLYVGRLSPEKDIATLISAFRELLFHRKAHLVIIGSGPDEQTLKNQVARLQIQSYVTFMGHQENPYPYFQHADMLVLTSTREGLPTVLIEALALGLKIVSTDCPSGPREILNEGKYGTLVPVGMPNLLAQAILSTLEESFTVPSPEELSKYELTTAVSAYIEE